MNENHDDTTDTVNNKKNTDHLFIVTLIQKDSAHDDSYQKQDEYKR